MAVPFGQQLKDLLAQRDLTQQAFAEKVGCSFSLVAKVVEGYRRPPPQLEAWADAFELAGSERESFLEAGYLLRTPAFIRERYLAIKGPGRSL